MPDEFGSGRIERTAELAPRMTLTANPIWTEGFVQKVHLSDEIDFL